VSPTMPPTQLMTLWTSIKVSTGCPVRSIYRNAQLSNTFIHSRYNTGTCRLGAEHSKRPNKYSSSRDIAHQNPSELVTTKINATIGRTDVIPIKKFE